MRRRIVLVATAAAVFVAIAMVCLAQAPAAPVLNQGTAGDRTVAGQAAPGSDPIQIYDTSYPTRTPIGQGKTSMDSEGNFAVSVDPPLVLGHKIVAVDKHGRSSAPMTVEDSDPAVKPQR